MTSHIGRPSGSRPGIIPCMARAEAERGGEPLVRSRTLPLLAGYWSFGQFWGVWVILVFEYQRQHALTDSRLGLMYSVLSLAAIGTMLAGAIQRSRDDDHLLRQAITIFDLLYAAYTGLASAGS